MLRRGGGASAGEPAARGRYRRLSARRDGRVAPARGSRTPLRQPSRAIATRSTCTRSAPRLFGFPRAIAHGMWTKARCLAALQSSLPRRIRGRGDFRKPILLPGRVSFAEARTEGQELLCGAPRKDELDHPSRRDGDAMSVDGAQHGPRPADAGTDRGLGSCRPARRAQARRAGPLPRDPRRLSRSELRAAAASRRRKRGRGSRAAQAGSEQGLFDLTPTDEQQMVQESFRPSPPSRCARRAGAADAAAAAPPELLAQIGELGLTHARRARRARRRGQRALDRHLGARHRGARSRRHGARRGCARARIRRERAQPVGRRRSAGDLPAGARRRGHSRRGDRAARAARAVRSAQARDDRATGRRRLRALAASRRSCRWPRQREPADRGCADRGSRPGLFLLEAGTGGVLVKPTPGMGVRAGAHRRSAARGRARARRRPARRRRSGRLRRVRAARAPGLVRAGAWARHRRCSTT